MSGSNFQNIAQPKPFFELGFPSQVIANGSEAAERFLQMRRNLGLWG
jgi:hypothetical protein